MKMNEKNNYTEIIKCKDCKHYKKSPYPDEDMMCWYNFISTKDNDFCSYGEKKVVGEMDTNND